MRTTCSQNFSSIWCCLLEPLPNIHQNGHNWVLNQKNVVLLLGRFENKKDAETESWHPERLEERFYYRLCENFWKSFGATIVGKFRPSFDPKNDLLFNFNRILWFFWDMGLMLFDITKDAIFAEILVFSNIFGFSALDWVPKWNKTVNFGCFPFKLKFKILKDFSNTVFVLLETTSG